MPKAEHHIVRDVQCRPEAACRLRFVGVGAAGGRRPASGSSASRLCRSGKLPAPPALARSAVSSRRLATRVFGVRAVSCSPKRAFSEVPGCGHPSCRSARGPVPASAALSPWRRIHRQPSARLRSSVQRPVSDTLARPFAPARCRRVAFQSYKGEEPGRSVAWRGGEKVGSRSGSRLAQSVCS